MKPFSDQIGKIASGMAGVFFLVTIITLLIPVAGFSAGVSVTRGPTPIKSGDANADGDITLSNGKIAVSIAAETPAPWGVARGGILDATTVHGDTFGVDRVTLVDFIPNNWSSWPTTYQKITIEENTPERAVVKTERDWGDCILETVYTLEKGADRIHMLTRMTNNGDSPEENILSGYVRWAKGGNYFGPSGLEGKKETSSEKALTDWGVSYDKNWLLAIHAPYMNHINYNGRDLYMKHTLAPKETRTFEGWFQILDSGDLAPVLEAQTERKQKQVGTVAGSVSTDSGQKVQNPYVVIMKNSHPYSWVQGENGQYKAKLPAGTYKLYATAKGYAKGALKTVTVEADTETEIDFSALKAPGKLSLKVKDEKTGSLKNARISIIEGNTPLIKFLGSKTFFTDLEKTGAAELELAPGEYKFEISAGENFYSRPAVLQTTVEGEKTNRQSVTIETLAAKAKDWYAADLHHHSDLLDGKTPPEYVLRSQLASMVDFAFLSDHDTMENNKTMSKLCEKAGIEFIPSIEISPSWGHFNAYPMPLDQSWDIDSGTATVSELFEYARKKGAKIIQQNHPFIPYGYYENLQNSSVNGSYDAGFDLVELNSDAEFEEAWKLACAYWSDGAEYYLSAGTDVHDVWNRKSGEIRMFAYMPQAENTEALICALKDGHAFASFGPMVFPENCMFGDEMRIAESGTVDLDFNLKSANGLKNAVLIKDGKPIKTISFDNKEKSAEADFSFPVTQDTWAAVIVEDTEGKKAYTNPVWINITPVPEMPEEKE